MIGAPDDTGALLCRLHTYDDLRTASTAPNRGSPLTFEQARKQNSHIIPRCQEEHQAKLDYKRPYFTLCCRFS